MVDEVNPKPASEHTANNAVPNEVDPPKFLGDYKRRAWLYTVGVAVLALVCGYFGVDSALQENWNGLIVSILGFAVPAGGQAVAMKYLDKGE